MKIEKTKIIPTTMLNTEIQIFEVHFNPHLKKAQNKYQIFTESVTSVTLGADFKLYISFIDSKYDDTTTYDELMKIISTIYKIDIVIGDKNGDIINTKHFDGKFTNLMHTTMSYDPTLKFLAIFELDKNKLK